MNAIAMIERCVAHQPVGYPPTGKTLAWLGIWVNSESDGIRGSGGSFMSLKVDDGFCILEI